LLTGAVTEQWTDNLKRIYDKAPEPKIAVAVGNCPQSGDVFAQEGGHVHAPASDFIPVAAAIPGCPPRPSEILEAILAVGPQAIADRGREMK
jgi:energy-converting hydrogenase A subunit N